MYEKDVTHADGFEGIYALWLKALKEIEGGECLTLEEFLLVKDLKRQLSHSSE